MERVPGPAGVPPGLRVDPLRSARYWREDRRARRESRPDRLEQAGSHHGWPEVSWKTLIQGGRPGAWAGPNAAAIGSAGSSSGLSGKCAAGIPQEQIANQHPELPPETCAQGTGEPHERQPLSGAALAPGS